MDTNLAAVEPTILQIKFDNLTFQEKAELFLVKALGLIVLIVVCVLSPLPILTYLAIATLVTIALVVAYSWLFKIARTEIRPEEGVMFQVFAHPSFTTTRQFDLHKYGIVTSNWRMGRGGAQWVSVLLSGRNGSVEIARFGPNGRIKEDYKSDHPEAKLLRSKLATQLRFRDLGVL